MSVFSDDNAITYRLAKMQKLWTDKIVHKTQFVRWLIESNEDKMLRAFSLTESSEHGKIPELFVIFETEFSNSESYGNNLINDFLNIWTDENFRDEVVDANVLPNWDSTPYSKPVTPSKKHEPFLDCMSSFTKSISDEISLVLFLNPPFYNRNKEWVKWIKKSLSILPNNLKIMIADYKENILFDEVYDVEKETLEANLNMQGAIKELIKSGDTNNPAVGVNMCILNISEASSKKDEKGINKWGKKGLQLAEEMQLPSIESTVLLAYGSAFYNLKKFDKAIKFFENAEDKSIEGIKKEDPASNALLLQSSHFLASTYFYKRNKDKAFKYYTKTAKLAKEQSNILLYLEASRQSGYIARKQTQKDIALNLLKEAFNEGKNLDYNTLKFSPMLLICNEIHLLSEDLGYKELRDEIANFATDIWGGYWQDMSKKDAYEDILKEQNQ